MRATRFMKDIQQEQRAIVFTVPAVPVAQPRPRATSIGGHAGVYEPKDHPIAAFKASVRLAASCAFKEAPIAGPFSLHCSFVFPRPKSLVWAKREMHRMHHVKKPDGDNLLKAVLDALNGLLWVDDAQACELAATKWIAAGDEQPHVVVSVRTL